MWTRSYKLQTIGFEVLIFFHLFVHIFLPLFIYQFTYLHVVVTFGDVGGGGRINSFIYIYIYHLFILLYSTMYVYKGFHVQTLQNNSAKR